MLWADSMEPNNQRPIAESVGAAYAEYSSLTDKALRSQESYANGLPPQAKPKEEL